MVGAIQRLRRCDLGGLTECRVGAKRENGRGLKNRIHNNNGAKRENGRGSGSSNFLIRKSFVGFEVGVLILSIFAFGFIIGEMEGVSGQIQTQDDLGKENDLGSEFGQDNQPKVDSTVGLAGASYSAFSVTKPSVKSVSPIPVESPTKSYGSSELGAFGNTYNYEAGVNIPPGTYLDGSPVINGVHYPLLEGEKFTFSEVSGGGYDWSIKNSAGTIRESGHTSGQIQSGSLGISSGASAQPSSTFSGWLGQGGGTFGDALVSGVQYAAIAYAVGYLVGGMLGLSDQNQQALATSLAAGAATWNFLGTYTAGTGTAASGGSLWVSGGSAAAFGWGVVVAAVVFLVMYKDEETEVVTFECLPWQAPVGGNVCERCNDESLPCSEYRCKSLGQNCELVNAGTGQEACVNVNPRDVEFPVISPSASDLTFGHEYTNVKLSPPGPGFNIVNKNSSDGCLKAFTPLRFGIKTNEPSQCKIDFVHTTKFDDMKTYFGGKNLFLYNHTEQFSLPGAKVLANSSLILENGKDLTLFIRCKDKNGNENSAEYAVHFCIDPSPDTTPPKIEATSVSNGACVAQDVSTSSVEFYLNEPANCKWSRDDQSYDLMRNEMKCDTNYNQINAQQLFACRSELAGIGRDESNFYVRCKDQPGVLEADRNVNQESLKFSLRGSSALALKTVKPTGNLFGGVEPAPIELYAETTLGCNNGQSICYYSTTGKDSDQVMFFDTNNADGISTQRQDLSSGDYDYYIKCIDAGGNIAEDKISFNLEVDTSAPVIARVYEEESNLKIVTVRKSQCSYSFDSCDFSIEEGIDMPYANSTVHVAEWNRDNTYYIKCRDEFKNENADCSAIVRPSRSFR